MSNAVEDRAFEYRTRKDGTVEVSWYGKPVTTIRGKEAAKFLSRVEGAGDHEAQLLMARATGNFKRGNEKRGDASVSAHPH